MSKRFMKSWWMLALLLGSTLILAGLCFGQAQTTGTISGTITDTSGAVVPGVKITVTNTATGLSQTTTTSGTGYYTVVNLPGGVYDVTAEKEGFQRCANIGVQLDPAATQQLTCAMQVGQMTQTVEVQAQALVVSTEDSKVSRVLNPTQITEMPLNGRNFVSLFGLQPGVVQEFTFNSFQGMSLFAMQGTHVNGLRGDANNLLIEGAPSTRTRANGAMVAAPAVDAIGEINIVTTGYLPEFSRGAGGQLVTQMKSGTQSYHGSVYEFLRNTSLDARNFFSATRDIVKYNNFGYTFGGPVVPHKNNLFFFWSQEWNRFPSTATNIATYPSAKARMGDFSQYCAQKLPCPVVPAYLNGVDSLVAGQPFPNNQIPPDLFSTPGHTNGAGFLNAMLVPNNADLNVLSNNSITNLPGPTNDRKETIKVDANLERIKSHLAVALRHYTQDNHGSWPSIQLENWEILLPSRGATVDLTTNFSPTLLNDFSFTATEDIVHVNLPGGPGLDRTKFGINFPYLLGNDSKDIVNKIPTVNLSGTTGMDGLPYPSGSVGKVFVAQDVITKIYGPHTLKAGVWIQQDGENDRDQVRISPGAASGIGNNMNGTFTFNAASTNPATTGAPIADALLGNYDSYSEIGFRNYTPWVATQQGYFVQDSWKVTRQFTIQGGLRWDYFPPYHSRWCNFSTFDPRNYNPASAVTVDPKTGFDVTDASGNVIGNPYNGISVPCSKLPRDAIGHFAVFGERLTSDTYDAINAELQSTGMQHGLSPEIFQKHHDNWQPRLGFAWDPFGKGTTSIRGSVGIFYNHFTLSDVTLMGGNTPFQPTVLSLNGRADCPGRKLDAQRNCLASSGSLPQLPKPETGGDIVSQVPEVYQFNFNVQHQFPQDTLVEVGYVGTRGKHLVLNTDLNQIPAGVLPAHPGADPNSLRPDAGLAQTTIGLNDSSSKYDSLQVSVQRRLNRGLQFGVAYTYSNSFDHGSSLYANAVNSYDLRYTWGPSDWNRRNILIFNYVYELPVGRGKRFGNTQGIADKVIGGWELAGVLAFQSGTPNTIGNINGDEAQIGEDFGQTADRFSGCSANNAPRTIARWFNGTCFGEATKGTFGNAGRNTVWGPPVKNWDFALYKNGGITERLRYQFRVEAFNFLNHASFNSIDASLSDCGLDKTTKRCTGSGAFGSINGAGDPRVLQFGLKILF